MDFQLVFTANSVLASDPTITGDRRNYPSGDDIISGRGR
jgi:hypothetical protein